MNGEDYEDKLFSNFIPLTPPTTVINKGILYNIFLEHFDEDRVKSLFNTNKRRHSEALNFLLYYLKTPRRILKFQSSLRRRAPEYKDVIDWWDLCLISAIEENDFSCFLLMITKYKEIFESKDDLIFGDINDDSKKLIKLLFYNLSAYNEDDSLEKYSRATWEGNWESVFLGRGHFLGMSMVVSKIIGKKNITTDYFIDTINEFIDNNQYEGRLLVEVIKDIIINLMSIDNSDKLTIFESIIKLSNSRRPLVNLIIDELNPFFRRTFSQEPPMLRMKLFECIFRSRNISLSLITYLYFYFVESEDRGNVVEKFSDAERLEVSKYFINFYKDISENTSSFIEIFISSTESISFFYRLKYASIIMKNDYSDILKDIVFFLRESKEFVEHFCLVLLKNRQPFKAVFSDNAIDTIDKLIGISKFAECIIKWKNTCEEFNVHVENAMVDFLKHVSSDLENHQITVDKSAFD